MWWLAPSILWIFHFLLIIISSSYLSWSLSLALALTIHLILFILNRLSILVIDCNCSIIHIRVSIVHHLILHCVFIELFLLTQLWVANRMILYIWNLLQLNVLHHVRIINCHLFLFLGISLIIHSDNLSLFHLLKFSIVFSLLSCKVKMLIQEIIVFHLEFSIFLLSCLVLVTIENVQVYLFRDLLSVFLFNFTINFFCVN